MIFAFQTEKGKLRVSAAAAAAATTKTTNEKESATRSIYGAAKRSQRGLRRCPMADVAERAQHHRHIIGRQSSPK